MSSYQFAGSLYRNEHEMLDAIAHSWITCSGRSTQDEVRGILTSCSDHALAADCICQWSLDASPDDWPSENLSPSHMATHGYETTDLERAFARFRADIEHDMDVEARGDDEMYAP